MVWEGKSYDQRHREAQGYALTSGVGWVFGNLVQNLVEMVSDELHSREWARGQITVAWRGHGK